MKIRPRRTLWILALTMAASGWAADGRAQAAADAAPSQMPQDDALSAYVRRPDPSLAWTERSRGSFRGAEYREMVLTSQTWRDIPWKHQLFIIRPSKVTPGRAALLFIAGGRWKPGYDRAPTDSGPPDRAGVYAALARRLEAPVAVLLQVPFQPILGMKEDALIAYSLEQYLRTGEADWPLLLPMVKAASAGMDAAQAIARDEWQVSIDKFVVTGASKRGWTTWLTAAVDPRVVALAPMVFDILDMRRQMAHQELTWGTPSEQIQDYKQRDLPRMLRTTAGDRLLSIVDPWRYRERITQPKLVILATNDPYWPVDSAEIYFDGLAGPSNRLYLPNSPHSPRDLSRLVGGVVALQRSVSGGSPLPVVTGVHEATGGHARLAITTDQVPTRVRVWYARSTSREFRAARWQAKPAVRNAVNDYSYRVARGPEEYVALMGEAEYGRGMGRFFLSTGLRIVGPDGVEPLASDPGVSGGRQTARAEESARADAE